MRDNEYGVPIDKNGYAPSIIPHHSEYCCYICQRNGTQDKLDRHEIFHGYNREKSKRLGLWVHLCHFSCHEFGKYAVHNNGDTDEMLKRDGQRYAMEHYGWDREKFIEEIGKDYFKEER